QDTQDALAQVAQRDAWLQEVATASVTGRLEGQSVGVFVAHGASADDVDQVVSALENAGASVGFEASMSAEWWAPELAAFRGEIADQVIDSVVGVEGLPSTEVLQHAIIQALVPDAVPAGADAPGDVGVEFPSDGAAADRADVLLEVLTRSELLSVSKRATGPVDALVMVTGDGPEGGGTMADVAASVWKQYVPATMLVVFGETESPPVATEAIEHGATLATANRPSIVIATESALVPPQLVFALVEQGAGGSGSYGTAENLPLIASP
ncbi:MAG: hypothetical protein CVT68_08110, partial [Actinobacteria bacterium HGW-Actinobacteria-8]